MTRIISALKMISPVVLAALLLAAPGAGLCQTTGRTVPQDEKSEQARPRQVADATGDQYFGGIYRNFYDTYKLGPADQLAIRVLGQPDYSLERAEVSPAGRIYHPLVGDVEVAGLTVDQLTRKLTVELGQFIIDPKVSISLLAANSALIGVLGDVSRPGIVVMSRPMTVLDALSASGGITDLGSKSNVSVLRQLGDGRMATVKVNVKRIMEGKANPEENVSLRAGDTIIVHGNTKKKISYVTSLMGFASFMHFILGR
ncbi:MAG TPA: polysaccharide biosynthesis/export family protein, partial [Blastocatellia bacterium]|nr:polysaccharide biosynthesis/export family protein [Blastocatellia bacterium]